MKEAISQFRDYPISVDFRHINGVDEEEYLNVLDELESKVNALIIAGLQTKRIVEKVNQIAKKITGDINKSIVYYSKLGIFQSFIELDDVNKLKKYVPSSIIKLDEHDRKHNTVLLATLSSYIKNNLSLKKTSVDLSINYRSASYRIQKIKEISNINFDDSIELLSIRNGLIIFDIIKVY